jgi:predicted GNAT family N-acyltransferase
MVSVVRIGDEAAAAAALAIRRRVFIEEQGVPEALELADAGATTDFLALLDGRPLATGRFRPVGSLLKFERIATLPAGRGRGIASALMSAMEAAAAKEHPDRLPYMHAQLSAAGFYAKIGWLPVGPPFVEAAIAHVEMVKLLGPPPPGGYACATDPEVSPAVRAFAGTVAARGANPPPR